MAKLTSGVAFAALVSLGMTVPAGAVVSGGRQGPDWSLRPGELIWARPLTDAAALPSAAANLRIEYVSATAGGRPALVTGTVAIPKGAPPAGGWPVLSWAHGTTGTASQCAPSLDTASGPTHGYLKLADSALNTWVSRGFAVVQTDYQGMGTPGPAPYLVGRAEASDVIYIVDAARHLDRGLSRTWFAMGHSQGGQAALFAAQYAGREARNLRLTGAVAIAPGNGFKTLADVVKQGDPKAQHALPLLPLIMLGMAAVDPALDPDQLVTSKGEQLLRAARNGCVASVFAVAATIPVADVFKPGADLTRLDADMAPNEPGTLDPPAPLLVAQGTADQIIDPARTVTMVSALCANGATVNSRTYPGVDHFGEIAASLPDVEAWVAGRLAGRQPPSTCQPTRQSQRVPGRDLPAPTNWQRRVG